MYFELMHCDSKKMFFSWVKSFFICAIVKETHTQTQRNYCTAGNISFGQSRAGKKRRESYTGYHRSRVLNRHENMYFYWVLLGLSLLILGNLMVFTSLMEAKSIPEVAFEWLCECGAFDQLRKQCECYTADFAVSVFFPWFDRKCLFREWDTCNFSHYSIYKIIL